MLLIKNGRILTMAEGELNPGCILIKSGKIAKVAPKIDIAEQDCTVLNVQGNLVMPGIIEAHSHIGISEEKKGFEGNDCNEQYNPVTPYLQAIDAINPMDPAFHNAIAAGITSVMVGPGSSNVVGGQFAFMKTKGRILEDLIVLAPAAMKVAFGENPKTNYDSQGTMPSTRMAIGSMLRETLFEASQYWKQKKNSEQNGEAFQTKYRMDCWGPVLDKKYLSKRMSIGLTIY